jgi:hypothetical protein
MQPPFKRKDQGSTPWRPTNLKCFAPVTQLADVACLNQAWCRFESCRGYAEMEQEWLGKTQLDISFWVAKSELLLA